VKHLSFVETVDRSGNVVDLGTTDANGSGLFDNREPMRGLDHPLAPSSPALVSARSKKSFSSINSPIFLCSGTTSTVGYRPAQRDRKTHRQLARQAISSVR
jgi:hypothetical protein